MSEGGSVQSLEVAAYAYFYVQVARFSQVRTDWELVLGAIGVSFFHLAQKKRLGVDLAN